MTGVNILNEFEVVAETAFSWTNFWWGALIGAVIGLIVGLVVVFKEGFDWVTLVAGCLILMIFIGGFVGILGGALVGEVVSYETHYEVTISEDVNILDFMDRYEIIETRGRIYTVKERTGRK